jgi:hypothetical protein
LIRADLIWLDKFNGDGEVWYNGGVREESDRDRLKGSIIEWSRQGKLYSGVARGADEYFMDYGKSNVILRFTLAHSL